MLQHVTYKTVLDLHVVFVTNGVRICQWGLDLIADHEAHLAVGLYTYVHFATAQALSEAPADLPFNLEFKIPYRDPRYSQRCGRSSG